jgi:hypothetical protein
MLLDMTIDTNGRVGNITEKTFSPRRSQKFSPATKGLEIPTLFLLECKQVGVEFKENVLEYFFIKF